MLLIPISLIISDPLGLLLKLVFKVSYNKHFCLLYSLVVSAFKDCYIILCINIRVYRVCIMNYCFHVKKYLLFQVPFRAFWLLILLT